MHKKPIQRWSADTQHTGVCQKIKAINQNADRLWLPVKLEAYFSPHPKHTKCLSYFWSATTTQFIFPSGQREQAAKFPNEKMFRTSILELLTFPETLRLMYYDSANSPCLDLLYKSTVGAKTTADCARTCLVHCSHYYLDLPDFGRHLISKKTKRDKSRASLELSVERLLLQAGFW